ncbi:MAG: hypothetical protein IKU34_09945 [Clostridia bacterium]|nr:hypothetical protein [Clostridia bacterium]
MEMASDCPRCVSAAQDSAPHKPVRGPHGGWQKREIDALRQRIRQAEQNGESLRSVFDDMGQQLGRKPNSIRNFYYAQLRDSQDGQPRTLPFETFSQEEIEQLIKSVLIARAQGMSVRACVRQLSGGDRTRMLRYQNKYRSVVHTRPELVKAIMQQLADEGVAFVSPYPGDSEPVAQARIAQLKSRAQMIGDEQIIRLFDSLSHLLTLAFDPPQDKPDAPQDSAALRRADRLKAQCDVLRIALDDERTRLARLRSEAEGMVTVVKEYIALPESDRATRCGDFCQLAAARLCAMECALMNEWAVPTPASEDA